MAWSLIPTVIMSIFTNVDIHTEYMQKGTAKASLKPELSNDDKNCLKSIETPRMSDKYSTFSEDTYSKNDGIDG